MKITRPIDTALCDRNLLGAALGDASSWAGWLVMLRAAFGLRLISDEQRQTFAAASGGRKPPKKVVREFWAIVGRGGGKSRIAAACAVHVALLQKHKLSPGEVGHVLVLSQTVAQARVVFDYALAFIEQSPILRQEVASTTQSEIRLRNNIIIGMHAASFRSVRGRSLLACIFDESSFWRDETSALPDKEAYRAVMPSLIRTNGMLIGISTPYRKFGLLYEKHKKYFGVDDPDILVVQGSSLTFNPLLNEAAISKALSDDPEANIAEWQAEFRVDIAAFLSDADIDACVDLDRPPELPPRDFTYHAFVDPSGGRHDVFTICIAHKEDERTIIDVLRGRHPPFDTKGVVDEYATLLREYRVHEVVGDNYAAEWVSEAFRAAGIKYTRSELPKGRLYIEGLPAFTRRTVSLPNHPRLLRELRLLERRPHVGGKDTIDHGRTGSDDHANALFGVLRYAAKRKPRMRVGIATGDGTGPMYEVDPTSGEPIERSEWFPGYALKAGAHQHAVPGKNIKMEPVEPGAPDPNLQRRLRTDLWKDLH